MQSFISDVLNDLKNKNVDFSKLTFILPSKRAGTFLINHLLQITTQTLFAPKIYSIEEFVQDLSQLKKTSNTELLFEFYTTYKKELNTKEVDSFESFSKWAQILLQDFNEIDRYLINESQIFNYLAAIQEINTQHWSLDTNKTTLVKNYLNFWNKLETFYQNFKTALLEKNIGYQGLMYREAFNNVESFIQENSNKHFVFLGFNALNTAEIGLIKELLHNDMASIYWDIDKTFVENKSHDAGLFVRQHKTWTYFEKSNFNWIANNYSQTKNISVVGTPKNVGQAKYIGELLLKLNKEKESLDSTALVLGNESLLFPILTSIPKEITTVNITMGMPLKDIPLSTMFDQLISIHKVNAEKFYYKDVISLLSNPTISVLFKDQEANLAQQLIEIIHKNNLVHLSCTEICELLPQKSQVLSLIFKPWDNSVQTALNSITELIYSIKAELDFDKTKNALTLEFLYKFNTVFNTINKLNSKFNYLDTISTFYSIYKEVLSTETLDFKGEPLKGLQIMGMLESRVLDFETVIISGVNEGILPSGKSNNSFIPFDVKIDNKLPTYKEKDAVYTYHFYHLLQRAKNVYIIYNTEPDSLNNGEMSRFITQLEVEGIHDIKHTIIAPKTPQVKIELGKINKTKDTVESIKRVANKGFSPSALTSYIRNPLDFYYQRVLGIYDHETVEETVEANTLGTVVHNTLEDLYTPFINSFLNVEDLKKAKSLIEKTTQKHFKKEYKHGDITKGKNLISFEIAMRYVSNFINYEIKSIEEGNTIKILDLEAENTVRFDIDELDFPVNLKGKVDRIDLFNGTTRIIDYKTGNVTQTQVEIIDWEDITTDYKKYSKSFQVLTYALMQHLNDSLELPIEAGIISFKNLSHGFLKFSKKEGSRGKKDSIITQETLEHFSTQLKNLILEICNPDIDFIEKEV